MMRNTDITIYNITIMIQLQLFSEENDRIVNSFEIKAIPQTKLSIDRKKFEVVGVIFHEGTSIKGGRF